MGEWHSRELAKADARPVPWAAETWFLECTLATHHYAHVSETDPSKLAYTPDDRHGSEDRQLRTRAGRYLNKYFSGVLTAQQIADYAGAFAGANEANSLQFASTPDDIERVYLNGPNSCMSHPLDSYETGEIHPTRAYGAGDLSIAYIVRGGDITARVLCYPAKLVHAVVYGDRARIMPLLESAGYHSDSGGEFNGARLLALDCDGGLAAPYMDGGYAARLDHPHLILDRCGDISLSNTSGRVGGGFYCDRCEEGDRQGEERCVADETWCEDCYENNASYCDHCDSSQPNDDGNCIGDSWLCQSCWEENGACCDHCGEGVLSEDTGEVSGGRYPETWCDDCRSSKAFECERCDTYFQNETTSNLDVNGETWCEDCSEHAFECQRCEEWRASDCANVIGRETWCDYCVEQEADDCADCCETLPLEDMLRYVRGGARHCEDCFDSEHGDRLDGIERASRRMLPAIASGARPAIALLPASATPAPVVLAFSRALAPMLRRSARVDFAAPAPMLRRSA